MQELQGPIMICVWKVGDVGFHVVNMDVKW
jgi:hypothetical protein